jgi:hypothetical protein
MIGAPASDQQDAAPIAKVCALRRLASKRSRPDDLHGGRKEGKVGLRGVAGTDRLATFRARPSAPQTY